MAPLLPIFILVAALVVLVASDRFRKDFRSYWLVSASGLGLAAAALLFLRLRLPNMLTLPGWWAGQGLEYPLNFGLSLFSWPLAFGFLALFAAGLLVELRRPGTASWLPWAPGLALAAAGLLAVLAGDVLAFAFAFFLFDLLALTFQLNATTEDARRPLFARFALNLVGVMFALIAWATPASYSEFSAVVLLLAAVLRLFPSLNLPAAEEKDRFDLHAVLQFGPLASAVALLCIAPPLTGLTQLIALIVLLGLALWASLRWLTPKTENALQYRRSALAALALASACAGAPAAVLGFGLNLLLGHALLQLPAAAPRARWPLSALAVIALTSLPFTPTHAALGLYASGASPLVFAFLLPQSLLLAGTAGRLFARKNAGVDSQPSLLLLPVVYLLFGLGLAPALATNLTLPIWPVAVIVGLAGAVFFLQRSGRSLLPPHLASRFALPLSTAQVLPYFSRAGKYVLALVGGLLEGEAGVIWALLIIALLISFVSQLSFAG